MTSGPDHPAGTVDDDLVCVRWGTPVTGEVPFVAAERSRDPRTALLRDHIAAMVSRTVGEALGEVSPPDRRRAHIVLAAHDYAVRAVRDFVAAQRDDGTRLRAVHSIALESSRLLRQITDTGPEDWSGRAVVVTTPDGADQAARAACAAVGAGTAPAAVACEVRIGPGGDRATVVPRATPVLRADTGPEAGSRVVAGDGRDR